LRALCVKYSCFAIIKKEQWRKHYVILPILTQMLSYLDMFEKYFYNTPHRQAYVSFMVWKIPIPHLKIVNSHISKTIYPAYSEVVQMDLVAKVPLQNFLEIHI
jgi:hypothetical protein